MSSRDVVLGRIRSALAQDGPVNPIRRDYIKYTDNAPGSEAVIELLTDRLVDYKALVRQVDVDGLPAAVDEALEGMSTIVIAPGLPDVIGEGCARHDRRVVTDTAPDTLTPQELDAVDAVVTTARVAIAMSGTIILDGGDGQGRRAISLVPDRHVVVLDHDQVVETVPEAIAMLEPTAPLTMIAGPSATSDIELERVEGVHGPRTLHVLIVR
jgi:L-lactate dehydrogenase complex protein LldG